MHIAVIRQGVHRERMHIPNFQNCYTADLGIPWELIKGSSVTSSESITLLLEVGSALFLSVASVFNWQPLPNHKKQTSSKRPSKE